MHKIAIRQSAIGLLWDLQVCLEDKTQNAYMTSHCYSNAAFLSDPNDLLNPCPVSELREDAEVAESSGDFHIKK